MNTEQLARETWLKLEACMTPQEEQDAIRAAIEKDRGEMWNTVDCQRREIERLRKLVESRAAHASEDLGDDQESGLPCECHGRISPHHGRTPAGQRAKRHQ